MNETPKQSGGEVVWQSFSNAQFEIGGNDLLAGLRAKHNQVPADEESLLRLQNEWDGFLRDIRIRIGTLLKTDSVSFLLGAGASMECGGVSIKTIPVDIEKELLSEGVFGTKDMRVRSWLKNFYLALCRASGLSQGIPITREEILQRREAVFGGRAENLPVNYEHLLTLLHQWRHAIPSKGGRLTLDGKPRVSLLASDIDECLRRTTLSLARRCILPTGAESEKGFRTYTQFLRKILTRPLNLKRTNVFTLNYDTLVEQASDAEGVTLIDGFVGTFNRVFRPESYDYDLYFPAETTEGRVHRHDRVIHLYKLHGSTTWRTADSSWDNPYGIIVSVEELSEDHTILVYPTPAKFGETLGMPYAELFRRFAASVARPQSSLFLLGYGFGDEHVNAIIRQALAIPSFTLVIVGPKPFSPFIEKLRERKDSRVWFITGDTFGRFSGFVDHVLPDLRDQHILEEVMKTYRALDPGSIVVEEGETRDDQRF